MPKPAREAGSTREKILEVAEDLIDRHGMDGLRLSEVAARVGIRPPSIFAHFEGRDAIGDAVAQRVIGEITCLLGPHFSQGGDPAERLRRGVRAFARQMHEHPSHARLLMRDLARTRDADLSMTSPLVDELTADLERLLEEGRRTGVFREYPASTFVALLQGAVLGRLGWHGYDDSGESHAPLPLARFQDEIEDLAMRLVQSG